MFFNRALNAGRGESVPRLRRSDRVGYRCPSPGRAGLAFSGGPYRASKPRPFPRNNISRRGLRNCRSLGFARDDKGEGSASLWIGCWWREPQVAPTSLRSGRDDSYLSSGASTHEHLSSEKRQTLGMTNLCKRRLCLRMPVGCRRDHGTRSGPLATVGAYTSLQGGPVWVSSPRKGLSP